MAMVKTGCLQHLNAEDFRFIANCLSAEPQGRDRLVELLTDESARDAALEDDRLLQALLATPEPLAVSPYLYFYVLTRRTLRRFQRDTTDYIAGLLAAFLDVRRLRALPGQARAIEVNVDYVTDMLAALGHATSETAFLIRAQVGNYTLFISGIFPEHIKHRAATRGAPDIGFYEEVGSTSYRLASGHELARRHALSEVYQTISGRFSEVRRDLNDLAERLMTIQPMWSPN